MLLRDALTAHVHTHLPCTYADLVCIASPDLPEEGEERSPVLLLGVTQIGGSPSARRRALEGLAGPADPRDGRPRPARGQRGDTRLDKIRQDLKFHIVTDNLEPEQRKIREDPKSHNIIEDVNDCTRNSYDACVKATGKGDFKQRFKSKHNQSKILSRSKKKDKCLVLHCVGACGSCKRETSFKYSHRGSFLFHRPEDCRQSSLCPSEPYRQYESESSNAPTPDCARGLNLDRKSSDILETHDEEFSQGPQGNARFVLEENSRKNLTPKLGDRRYFLLSNLNERFRKTLSLDSKKVDAKRTPLVHQQGRPKSMVSAAVLNPNSTGDQLAEAGLQSKAARKKKRFRPKSFFSLDTFFDSRRSDSSSVDDYSSSKYKKFELESDDSPILKSRQGEPPANREREKTPDLLDLPFISASGKNKSFDPSICKRRLEKLQNHYNQVQSQNFQNTLPYSVSENIDGSKQGTSSGEPYNQVYNDEEVEYIEPIKSNFTSQSTLTLDSKLGAYGCRAYSPLKPDSILSLNTDDTDLRLEGTSTNYTVSPKSNSEVRGRVELESVGDYTIEVKGADVIAEGARILVVKTMDKSVDSIGSCSLDVDASTDFSDTTSGSLNLLTPSSTTSRVRDFTSRIQDRALAGAASCRPGGRDRSPKCVPSDTATQRSHHSRAHHKKPTPASPHKKPSYLNLACSVNGYTHLTTYDSKLRRNINASREASPIRPIAYRPELVVPVPVSADRLLVTYAPNDRRLTAMAAENRQLKSDFLASDRSADMPGRAIIQSRTHDEVDNVAYATKERIFKSSFSETSVNNSKLVQSRTYLKTNIVPSGVDSRLIASESYTIHNSNGVAKNVEMTRDNGEKLTSPMKSFIQQRVERLYGPGALAQGFFNQKRQKDNAQYEESVYASSESTTTVLTEKSMNRQVGERLFKHKSSTYKDTENFFSASANSTNGDIKCTQSSPALPVFRHLRPEFRAQLPMLSPKKTAGGKSPGALASPSESTRAVPNQSAADLDNAKINTVVESRLYGRSVNVDGLKADVVAEPVPMIAEATVPIPAELASSNTVIRDRAAVKELCSDFVDQVRLGEGGGEANPLGGLYFLELKKRETERLIALAVSAEDDIQKLQDKEVSEEVLGLLRSAAGKARLLATQKMQQFEGLCYNNINRRADERFPTTAEDLRGFWDMVCLQVQHVDVLYQQLQLMRENQWVELPSPVKSVTSRGPNAGAQGKQTAGAKLKKRTDSSISCPAKNEKARIAARKREADRKALLETRRKMAREKQLATRISVPAVGNGQNGTQDSTLETDEEVKIFVSKPSSKGAMEVNNGTLEPVTTNGDALAPEQSS